MVPGKRKMFRSAFDHWFDFFDIGIRIEALRNSNLTKFWKEVRSFRQSKSSIPPLIKRPDGSLAQSPTESLNIWSSHLEKISKHDPLDQEFNAAGSFAISAKVKTMLSDNTPSVSPLLDSIPTSDEILLAMKTLKNTPPGVDKIYAFSCKNGISFLLEPLTILIQECWLNSSIPDYWKLGKAFYLFKKGDPLCVDNYRTITLQTTYYKLLDIIINNRLKIFLHDFKKISSLQAGYRPKRMSMDWSLILSELIARHANTRKPLYMCFFDAHKAFDRVWLDGLIHHLYEMGIRGPCLKILYSMYSNSKTTVDANGFLSEYVNIQTGVKQGGCSSPQLYLCFINSLIEKLKNSGFGYSVADTWLGTLLYCDDTVIIAETPEELQHMINIVAEHCNTWRCKMSVAKTVIFTTGCPYQSQQFHMNGSPLTEEPQVKHLGCTLSRNASPLPHCNTLISKLQSAIKGLMMIGLKSSEFTISTSVKLFNTIAIPSAIFGTEALPLTLAVINKLDILSRKFFRHALMCVRNMPNDVLYGELGLMSFKHYQNIRALQSFWRISNMPHTHLLPSVLASLPTHPNSFLSRIQNILTLYSITVSPTSLTKQNWTSLISNKIKIFCNTAWAQSIKKSTALTRFYNIHKQQPGPEPYLNSDGYASRLILKLRSGFSPLYACIGKYDDLKFEDRLCPLCQEEPEDTLHFLIRCSKLAPHRTFLPNEEKALTLLGFNTTDIDTDTLVELYKHRNIMLHSK